MEAESLSPSPPHSDFYVDIYEGVDSHPVLSVSHAHNQRPWPGIHAICEELFEKNPSRFARSVVIEEDRECVTDVGSMVMLRVTSFGTEATLKRKRIDVPKSERPTVVLGEMMCDIRDFDADMRKDEIVYDLGLAKLGPHICLCACADGEGYSKESLLRVPTAYGKTLVQIVRIIEPRSPTSLIRLPELSHDLPTSVMGTSVWIQGVVVGVDARSRFRR